MSTAEVVSTMQPVRKSAQRLRGFAGVFQGHVADTASETGHRSPVGKLACARVFALWIKAFDAPKPSLQEDKKAYLGFAAASWQTAFAPAWRSRLKTHRRSHQPQQACV